MDPVSGLKGELFRPLVSVLIPGVFAAAPFGLIAFLQYPLMERILASTVGAGAVILFGGLIVGMVLEDIGSTIEVFIWKWVKNEEREAEWSKYLSLKTNDEIIGERYLKSLHVRMKFELAMIPAIISFTSGANLCNHLFGGATGLQMWCLTIAMSVLLGFLIWQAYLSGLVLADTRKQIIAACEVQNQPDVRAVG